MHENDKEVTGKTSIGCRGSEVNKQSMGLENEMHMDLEQANHTSLTKAGQEASSNKCRFLAMGIGLMDHQNSQ